MHSPDPRHPGSLAPEGHRDSDADREKRAVALSSVLAAVVLTATKLVVGVMTQSLGILSEALHSALDLIAAGLTLVAVRVSGKPADPDHPYGHGKIENLSALLQTVLLLITCGWIAVEGIERLFFKHIEVEANHWAFLVVILSMVIDFSRSRALLRVARKHHSAALEADALHFSTDLWSSAVVLVGLGIVFLARLIDKPWLAHADAVAALIVAGIVAQISWQLGRRNIDALLDRAQPDLRERLVRAVLVPGVRDVLQLRLRSVGPDAFVDITVSVDRGVPFERAHEISVHAEEAVRALLPRCDVVIHVEPVTGANEGLLDLVRLLAAREGLTPHDIRVHEVAGKLSIDLHLEIAEPISLQEADRRARTFEESLRAAAPRLESVTTHLEPAGTTDAQPRPASAANLDRVRAALRLICGELGHPFEAHAFRVHLAEGKLSVAFHCVLDDETTLADAHRLSDEVERRLKLRLPEVNWVTIRVEPPGAQCPEATTGPATPQPQSPGHPNQRPR